MNAIGYGFYLVAREHAPGYFSVLLCNSVNELAEPKPQISHIELVIEKNLFPYLRMNIFSKHLFSQFLWELVMTCRYRSVRGENTPLPHFIHRIPNLREPVVKLNCQQRRMSLVHMILSYPCAAKALQHPYSSDSQNNLLRQPVLVVMPV